MSVPMATQKERRVGFVAPEQPSVIVGVERYYRNGSFMQYSSTASFLEGVNGLKPTFGLRSDGTPTMVYMGETYTVCYEAQNPENPLKLVMLCTRECTTPCRQDCQTLVAKREPCKVL